MVLTRWDMFSLGLFYLLLEVVQELGVGSEQFHELFLILSLFERLALISFTTPEQFNKYIWVLRQHLSVAHQLPPQLLPLLVKILDYLDRLIWLRIQLIDSSLCQGLCLVDSFYLVFVYCYDHSEVELVLGVFFYAILQALDFLVQFVYLLLESCLFLQLFRDVLIQHRNHFCATLRGTAVKLLQVLTTVKIGQDGTVYIPIS